MRRSLNDRMRIFVSASWVASLWMTGIQAAHLFATLERPVAGAGAARLFTVQAWVSVVFAAVLAALVWKAQDLRQDRDPQRRRIVLLIAAAFACMLAMRFGVQPEMAELRSQAAALADPAVRARFGALHGVASMLYGAETLLATLVLWKLCQAGPE